MNVLDLTVDQLKRAVAIKEQIDKLSKELGGILGGSARSVAAPKKTPAIGAAPAKTPAMSDAVKKKIAATQKARWAMLHGSKTAPVPVNLSAKPSKTNVSAATRAKLSAKLKAFWALKKAGKK